MTETLPQTMPNLHPLLLSDTKPIVEHTPTSDVLATPVYLYVHPADGESAPIPQHHAAWLTGFVNAVDARLGTILHHDINGFIQIVKDNDAFVTDHRKPIQQLLAGHAQNDNTKIAAVQYGMVRPADQLITEYDLKKGNDVFLVDIRGSAGTTTGGAEVVQTIPEELLDPKTSVFWYDDVIDTGVSLATFLHTRRRHRTDDDIDADGQRMLAELGDGFDRGFDKITKAGHYDTLAQWLVDERVVVAAEISKNEPLLAAVRQKVRNIKNARGTYDETADRWATLQREIVGTKKLGGLLLKASGWLMGAGTLDTKITGQQLHQILQNISKSPSNNTETQQWWSEVLLAMEQQQLDQYAFRFGAGVDLPLFRMQNADTGADVLTTLAAFTYTQAIAAEHDATDQDLRAIVKSFAAAATPRN